MHKTETLNWKYYEMLQYYYGADQTMRIIII